jgi:hypothetical protein
MKQEQIFYDHIVDTPELPPDLYDTIEQKIRKRSVYGKVRFALAASLILILGGASIMRINKSSVSDTLQPEVASELQIIHDYLNSSDLEEDLSLYAVVEGY